MEDLDVQAAAGTGGLSPGPNATGDGAGRSKPSWYRRRLAWLANPAWERAPGLLLRFPGLLAAVVGAAFVLAVASASQPLFVSSASNAALHSNLQGLCPWTGGLKIQALQPLSGPGQRDVSKGVRIPPLDMFQQRDTSVRQVTQGVAHLGPVEVTVLGGIASASTHSAIIPLVRLMSRDGFPSHIHVLSDAGGSGVWLPDITAGFLEVKAGDRITLEQTGTPVKVRVEGIYRSLSSEPLSTFWCSRTTEIYGVDPNAVPPALILVDRPTMFDLSNRLGELNASIAWELPVDTRGLTLEQAQVLSAQTAAAQQKFLSPYGTYGSWYQPQTESDIQAITGQVIQTVDQIKSPAASVALAGRLVALLVVAGVGVYWLDRRRTEVALLATRGVGPVGVASKTGLEALLPIALAGAGGWFAAIWLVRWLGPGSLLSAGASTAALWTVVWTSVVGLILLVATVALVVRTREGEGGGAAASIVARTPWELLILLLMAASLYEILTRGGGAVSTAGGPAKVDILLILFPVLFVAGTSGLAARGLRRLLPKLRALGGSRSAPVFLATRRLTAASGIALGLVTAVALAVGILAYSGALSASTEASAAAKAEVFVGSDFRATLLSDAAPPPTLSANTTVVEQVEQAFVQPSQVGVTVLAVDPATFARGAYWDPSLSARSLAELMREIARSGPTANLLVAGGSIPSDGDLQLVRSDTHLKYQVADTVKGFPTQTQHEILVIVDKGRLDPKVVGVRYLLGTGSPAAITSALAAAHVAFSSPVTTEQVRRTPAVIALSWLYGYLLALGVLTGLIVLAALVLYLAARQRGRVVSYALARRMGLTAGQHRRSLALEIAGMLVIGFVLGAGLAWLGARLVYAKLDPLPALPPPALFRVPWALLGAALAVLLVAAWAGARLVQRRAARADVSEVMRVGA